MENAEVLAIGADGEVERRTAFCGVVEDEYDAAVAQTDSVEAGIRVGQIERVDGRPVEPFVFRIGDTDFGDLRSRSGVKAQSAVLKADHGGLDDAVGAVGGRCLGVR